MNSSPGQPELLKEYLELAERLAGRAIEEPELSTVVFNLAPITFEILDGLAEQSKAAAHIRPKYGWALARVGDVSAVVHDVELRLKAMAAWFLGRAANFYYRPHLAAGAIGRARNGFKVLDDPFWLAACDWQFNVLAWARPNLSECLTEVEQALAVFMAHQSPPVDFRNDCRFTLAYIQTLIGRFTEAYENLDSCEKVYHQEHDPIGIIRCKQTRGNALYRQSKFDEAIVELRESIALAKRASAPAEEGLSLLRLGDVYFKRQLTPGQYLESEAVLLEAMELLKSLDLRLWEGLLYSGLSNIYTSRGNLTEAGEALDASRMILEGFDVDAPLATVLIGLGWLETYRGNYEQGLAVLNQAETIMNRVGNRYMIGVCHMHLGELYLEMGRYQLSLHYLEQAIEAFKALDSPGRIAECGLRLSRCWRALGQPDRALEALNLVEVNAAAAKQGNIFPYLHIRRAESFFDLEKMDETVDGLRKALAAAAEFEDRTGMGLAYRLLGETLVDNGEMEAGAENLEAADNIFNEIALIVEQAACQVAWGNYHRKFGNDAAARRAWRKAVEMGRNLAPDMVWQAEAGLAAQAEDAGNLADALDHYRRVVEALTNLRQDIWQPALAGFFLKRPIGVLDRAIRLAVRVGAEQDALNFVEASKAQVMAKLFNRPFSAEVRSAELANLAANIRWRQERVRALAEGDSLLRSVDYLKLRQEIRDLVRDYDLLRSRIERQYQSSAYDGLASGKAEFDLERFRRAANEQFGDEWVALDYYELKNQVICVLITGESCQLIDLGYPGRVKFVVSGMGKALATGNWQQGDIDTIGRWLLPDEVLGRLAPDVPLLIAPHRQLNYFPWPALTVREGPVVGPLVSRSIPVIVPSLQSLAALMARSENGTGLDKGLLLAVSEFDGRHTSLPFVADEIESLSEMFPDSVVLFQREATWKNLKKLVNEAGLTGFGFMHFASHAFADTVSGRLSGLAMYDRDIWLDELREIGPFPSLVTLSACSGSKGKFYEGDEQVGLATTFLSAGASQVVASLWPIRDEEAAVLMKSFYGFLHRGEAPGMALALAQRLAIEQGIDMVHWAGFRCTGLPV